MPVKRKQARRTTKRVAGFPVVPPSAEGLAEEPLAKLKDALGAEVGAGALAGAAHLVLRRGRCVLAHSDGFANVRAKQPFGLRTLCRLHGCTKPLVAAAFLTLVDKGKVKLADPIGKYISFSGEVSGKGRGKRQRLKARKVKVQPTLRHLLTMTAGLQYQDCPAYAKTMRRIKQRRVQNLASMCEELAAQPLQSEPGSRYTYSFCTDMIGRVCEAVSGKRLDKFVNAALLSPLGMRDTFFEVPAKKRKREAVLYDCQRGGGGKYVPKVWSQPGKAVPIMSAGGGILSYNDPGMWSTVEDYAKFCQMLLTGKSPRGAVILRPSTMKALWSDSLAVYGQKALGDAKAKGGMWDYTGWRAAKEHPLDLQADAITEARSKRARVGQTMWMGGGGGTFWVVDKGNETCAISFSQSFGGRAQTDAAKDVASRFDRTRGAVGSVDCHVRAYEDAAVFLEVLQHDAPDGQSRSMPTHPGTIWRSIRALTVSSQQTAAKGHADTPHGVPDDLHESMREFAMFNFQHWAGRVESQAPPSDNLYIADLPPGFTAESLQAIFQEYGNISQFKLLQNSGPGGKTAALVRFQSVEEATWLVENLNHNIPQGLSSPVIVKYADTPEMKAAKQGGFAMATSYGSVKGMGKAEGNGKGAARVSPYPSYGKGQSWNSWEPAPMKGFKGGMEKGKGKGKGCPIKTLHNGLLEAQALPGCGEIDNDRNALYISGLPNDTEDIDLYRIFAPFGAIAPRGVRAMRHPDGTCQGFGFVNYLESGSVQLAAATLHGTQMPGGAELIVKPKEPGKKKQQQNGLEGTPVAAQG
ncbi:unnamed protein product [Symbiodinium microadriaticum]|nr:unnamed protein product [Symbiodinium microadriaticum]